MLRGGRRAGAVWGVFLVALCWPAGTLATTVTIDDPSPPATSSGGQGCECTLAQGFLPAGETVLAPAAGLIRAWRVTAAGSGTIQLDVLHYSSEPEGFVNVGMSTPATNLEGQPNVANLPIRRNDKLGLTMSGIGIGDYIGESALTGAEVFEWKPALAVDGSPREFEKPYPNKRLDFGAEEILAPVLTALSQSSGSTTGGNAVTITGKYLDGATSVTFGSAPASSFSVESSTAITAIAPATSASTVDVRVSGPGGSSEVIAADHYTFTAPGSGSTTPGGSTTTPGGGSTTPGGGSATVKPVISAFSQSASRWKRAGAATRAGGTPVGTTFSFRLNEPARVTLLFSRHLSGRRVHGRCVSVSASNRSKQKCKRTISVGSLVLAGRAGLNKVRFRGTLPGHGEIAPGAYSATVMAQNANRQDGLSPSLSFTVLPG